MLFHEPVFLFAFLPLTLLVCLLLRRFARQETVVAALCGASLVFYGWWNPAFLPLLIGSILGNFVLGRHLTLAAGTPRVRLLLAAGVAANLTLLAIFKYLGMIAATFAALTGLAIAAPRVELPLGISFFTFLQIAYLVDSARGGTRETRFAPYFLFVTFFPHLIAGPLVHHRELIPQFGRKLGQVWENLAAGGFVFVVGLFKKLVLADAVCGWSDAAFNGAAAGIAPGLIDAWIGALSFTLLIYFDFSAYSDMAIGLSKMFGIRLPENFNSPYKAASIVDFWRRWHITLSRFLRDYLYVPLGGNRKGPARRYLNLMVVMLLAGLWHGASWKFVFWGGLHGVYLLLNHAWRAVSPRRLPHALGVVLTFLAALAAWVPFRADTWEAAISVYRGMVGLNGVVLPAHYRGLLPASLADRLAEHGVSFGALAVYGGGMQLAMLALLLGIVWFLPNTQQVAADYTPVLSSDAPPAPKALRWRPSLLIGLGVGAVGAYLLLLAIQGKAGEFIYFQF